MKLALCLTIGNPIVLPDKYLSSGEIETECKIINQLYMKLKQSHINLHQNVLMFSSNRNLSLHFS